MNEPILMSVGTSDPRGNGMKHVHFGGQRSRSHEAKDRFEAPFSTSWVDGFSTSWVEWVFFCVAVIDNRAAVPCEE